jgi:hypothetical protein
MEMAKDLEKEQVAFDLQLSALGLEKSRCHKKGAIKEHSRLL